MCADDLDTIKLIEIATQNPTGVNLGVDNVHARRPDGNSQQASLRRLRKHAPEIHKQVKKGALSAHAGMLKVKRCVAQRMFGDAWNQHK
jgi:hypothetical protein